MDELGMSKVRSQSGMRKNLIGRAITWFAKHAAHGEEPRTRWVWTSSIGGCFCRGKLIRVLTLSDAAMVLFDEYDGPKPRFDKLNERENLRLHLQYLARCLLIEGLIYGKPPGDFKYILVSPEKNDYAADFDVDLNAVAYRRCEPSFRGLVVPLWKFKKARQKLGQKWRSELR
jgi:hypothetical protein